MREVDFSNAGKRIQSVSDPTDAGWMPSYSYESVAETLHLLESPVNAARLAQSILQLRAGRATERSVA